MKSTTDSTSRRPVGRVASAAAALAAVLAGAPTVALASSSSNTGAELLLPKPAEFIPALIAFIIIWIIMSKVAWPSIVGMLDKRQAKIQGDLDAAADAKSKAEEEQKAYEQQLQEAHAKADEIIADAKREAEEQRAQILAKAQKDAAGIITKAHAAVESERHKAMIELSGSVVDLSVEIAGKIIGNNLSADEHRKLAEKYLREASEVGAVPTASATASQDTTSEGE